jgi:hypothetical protein
MYDLAWELTDTDHCMVFAKVRERLAVSKRAALKFDVDRS